MNDATSSTTKAADKEQMYNEIKTVLHTISEKLGQQDGTSAASNGLKLLRGQKPLQVMELLATNLFVGAPDKEFTADEALRLVLYLATSEPDVYLKPASRAIKSIAQQLASASLETMKISDHLLELMVGQLSASSDVEVSDNATDAIVACCQCQPPEFAERALTIIQTAWLSCWENENNKKSVIKTASTISCMRCANAIVKVILSCRLSESIGSTVLNVCVLPMLTDAADPLLQMTTLDLLERLTTSAHASAHQWLYSSGVVQPLLQMAGSHGTADPILGGPALRLLSRVCKLTSHDESSVLFRGDDAHQVLTHFHHALNNFSTSGELNRLALLDAISSFASASPQALELILQDSTDIKAAWLSLAVAQPKLKAAVLHSVAMVMDPAQHEQRRLPRSLLLKLYTTWGQVNGSAGSNGSELILSLTKSTLVEVRLGAYALIEAVARAGIPQVVTPELIVLLLSREGVETTKEGKEAKFAVVVALLEASRGLMADNSMAVAMQKYIRQGPHHVVTQSWDLATE